MSAKRIIIIAGPNGAGKTTFAREYLPEEGDCPMFVNADLIAEGLSPFRPDLAAIRSGRVMLSEIKRHAAAGRSFAFETTLSGRAYVARIRRWRAGRYHVTLFFLALPTPEEAIKRVRLRVSQGGHRVPEDVIRRRFASGRRSFADVYRHEVDEWLWYDNSNSVPVLIKRGSRGEQMPADTPKQNKAMTDPAGVMAALLRAARRAHEIARATGTKVAVRVDDKSVEMEPNPEMFDELDPDDGR